MTVIYVLCLVTIYAHGTHADDTTDGPVTTSPYGTFRGTWMETRRGKQFQAYRGIRYAEPPVGELRFQPPRLIRNYKSEVNATADGPYCPQRVQSRTRGIVSEDCLVVNVYTPDNNSSRALPVLLYMHSGGWYSVSGRSDMAGPHFLLEFDMVLVTINYRLGALGFLSTGDELAPGNNGLKDQVAALRWIQRYIQWFGGDPNLVTLSGYSAGSISVMLHMISNMSEGLFHRAISMSGAPTYQTATPTHQYHLAVRQAEVVGCPTDNSTVIVNCLKNTPWDELGDSLDLLFEYGFDPILLWLPVIEPDFGQERFLEVDPTQAIQHGNMHPVPYIISQTSDEFYWKAFYVLNNETLLTLMRSEFDKIAPISFLLPRNNTTNIIERFKMDNNYLGGKEIANNTETAVALGKLYADGVIGFAVHRLSKLMALHSTEPVYFYEFTYMGNSSHYVDSVTGKPLGAAHHDDLIYLFTLPAVFPAIQLHTNDSAIVDKMTAIFYNFIRYGDPNPRGDTPAVDDLSWPAMTYEERKYLKINLEFTIDSKLYEERYEVWEDLFPLDY